MKTFFSLVLICIITLVSCQNKTETAEVQTEANAEVQTTNDPVQWLNFKGKSGDGQGKNIVFITGDEEYRSEEGLTQLAKILSHHHGFDCTVLFAQDPEKPGFVDSNYLHNIPGLESLEKADLMVILTRFRALPNDQMVYIDNYLKSGKPVVGLRTATHAFNFEEEDTETKFAHYGNGYKGDVKEWEDGFGRLILGEKWISHHGHHRHQSTKGIVTSKDHPITNGIEDGDVWGSSDVYGVRLPLPGDAQPIILGQVMNRTGEYDEEDSHFGLRPDDTEIAKFNSSGKKDKKVNEQLMPVVWTMTYQIPDGKSGKAFTSTVAASVDLLIEGTRRVIVNGVFWSLGLSVPEKANVDIVGDYNPSQFMFHEDEYWDNKNMKISDMDL